MSKKTKADLEKENQDLKRQLKEAGLLKKKTLEDKIMETEIATIEAVDDLIVKCEKATGRHLSILDPMDQPCSTTKIIMHRHKKKQGDGNLKEQLRDLGDHVRKHYTFKNLDVFRLWSKKFLREGWDGDY